MTQHDTKQPQIKIGLIYQRSILHQLYDFAIIATKSCEKLERTWEDISHEEEIVIGQRQKKQQ
jgi:hypothetical protein